MGESIKVRKIGQYILKKKLGEGSMGSVWLSHHSGLNLPVAIKLLNMQLAEEDPDFLNRFMQEGRLAGQLNHKNIIRIYDAGIHENSAFIVMEYIEGCDTLELLKTRGALPAEEVLALAIAISEALQEAHSLGIIHRDIKPDNILATTEGKIKLADMGLAKNVEDNAGGTMAGTALGTPYYIAPEQALDAATVDTRSDIYSFGATLYHLLTGVVPYEGDNPMGVMLKHSNEELIPPQKRKAGLPISFCNVICKMMEKNPDDRYQSCIDLHVDLIKLKSGHQDIALSKEADLKRQRPSLKSVRRKKQSSEKHSKYEKNITSGKKRSKPTAHSKKQSSNTKYIVMIILFIAVALAVVPLLFKKQPTATTPKSLNDETAIDSSQSNTNNQSNINEEAQIIAKDNSTRNLLADNGNEFFESGYPEFFTFENNLLFIDDLGKNPSTNNGLLTSKETFKNYRLTVEYKTMKKNSDSGIHFHVNDSQFFEVQFGTTATYLAGYFLARACYFNLDGERKLEHHPEEDFENALGQWNQLIIECKETTLKVTLNNNLLYDLSGLSLSEGKIRVTCWQQCKMLYRKLELENLK